MSEQEMKLKILKPVSLYIHIPFCRRRCNYCDFNTFANMETFIPDYVRVLREELRGAGSAISENEYIHSINRFDLRYHVIIIDGNYRYDCAVMAIDYLEKGGVLLIEFGINQSEAVYSHARQFFRSLNILKDLSGIDRFLQATLE